MVTNLELKYRSLDELVSAASIDLHNWYSDGIIEIAELIKVAQRCNYELGIQINQTKETILEVDHYRTKLPADFQFLNFAVLCHHHREETHDLWPRGLVHQEEILYQPEPITTANINNAATQSNTVFCWTVVINSNAACTDSQHCSEPGNFSIGVQDANGNWSVQCLPIPSTTTLCAMMVKQDIPGAITCPFASGNKINAVVTQGAGCYLQPDGSYGCIAPPVPGPNCAICNTPNPAPDHCCGTSEKPNCDPWNQNKVYSICDDKIGIRVIDSRGANTVREYRHFEQLYMQPSRQASAFSSSQDFRTCSNQAFLRNGYLECSRECAKVYINYQGLLENENGELLVLDHPIINEWMEHEVKLRILENLYLNGEPDIERRLKYLEGKTERYKRDAMNIAYMPDFKVIAQTYKKERDNMNRKYFEPFSRYSGWNQNSAFFDKLVNGHYRQ